MAMSDPVTVLAVQDVIVYCVAFVAFALGYIGRW